jgi:hypothetical protein
MYIFDEVILHLGIYPKEIIWWEQNDAWPT